MASLLNFSVEGITCAIPNDYTLFVVQMISLINPAEKGEWISGMANIEGSILPVYSLRRLFGFDNRPPRTSDVMIIAQAGLETVALWVDETADVRENPTYEDPYDRYDPAGLCISTDGVVVIYDLPAFLRCADREAIRAMLPQPSREVVMEVEDPAQTLAVLEKRAEEDGKAG